MIRNLKAVMMMTDRKRPKCMSPQKWQLFLLVRENGHVQGNVSFLIIIITTTTTTTNFIPVSSSLVLGHCLRAFYIEIKLTEIKSNFGF